MKMKNSLFVILLSFVYLGQAQDVKIEYTKTATTNYISNYEEISSRTDTLLRKTILLSNKKREYVVKRNGNGRQIYDSIRYEYQGDDTLIVRTFTPICANEDLSEVIAFKESIVDTITVAGESLQLFDYDDFSMLRMYDDPYEYLSDSMPYESIIIDTILENEVFGENQGHVFVINKSEHIISETRFYKCNKRTWFSFCSYGVPHDSKFLSFMYTTMNRRLMTDCFITNEFCIKRVFFYDDFNRLIRVLVYRINILTNNELIEWNDFFIYEGT